MITGVSSTAASATNSADRAQLAQGFDQFLRLLTTQLQNQDPLSPMDSTEFTNQLVSFSSVEQQIKINDNLTQLLALSNASQATLGLSYIGLNVDMQGSQFLYDGTNPARMSYTLPADATRSTVSILDENGAVVFSQAGETAEGKHEFVWNGTDASGKVLPAGAYELRVGAIDTENKNLPLSTTVSGIVAGIETAEDGEILLLINGQKVPMSTISRATL